MKLNGEKVLKVDLVPVSVRALCNAVAVRMHKVMAIPRRFASKVGRHIVATKRKKLEGGGARGVVKGKKIPQSPHFFETSSQLASGDDVNVTFPNKMPAMRTHYGNSLALRVIEAGLLQCNSLSMFFQ